MNGPSVHQGVLETVVRSLFKGENILSNARKESSLVNPSTGSYLEVDIWLPHKSLCFEFQDPYHYIHTWDSNAPTQIIQQKDRLKQERILHRGETLVLIPCWWDGQEESFVATVQFLRPDLLQNYKNDKRPAAPPITINPSYDFFLNLEGFIPGIGELMLASFPTSMNFVASVSPENSWWMGEKYDGVRCCWNVYAKKLYSRSAMKLLLPQGFMALMGSSFFDAELWLGRGFFPEAQLISSTWDPEGLSFLRIVCFDDSSLLNRDSSFEARYAQLLYHLDCDHQFLILASRVLCLHQLHLTASTQAIIDDGGEGVILRLPGSPYLPGRSPYLIKFKASRGDKEAMVLRKDPIGDPILLLPDGTTFKAQSQGLPLRAGDIVTFSYESYSPRSLPVNPLVTRVRLDKFWREIVREFRESQQQNYNGVDQKYLPLSPKPAGYWLSDQRRNMREVFEKFARSRNFEPLVAKNWYPISKLMFRQDKDARAVIANFRGSFIRALLNLFPDIGLDERKFIFIRRKYWQDPKNRRNFYLKFAHSRGFDPFVASNWYKYNYDSIIAAKGSSGVLSYYKGSYGRSLIHLFPEISFRKFRFFVTWRNREKRRKYFEKLAQANGFDPLSASGWYSTPMDKYEHLKNVKQIIKLFGNNLQKAILDSFPDVSLEEDKFTRVANPFFTGKSRRNFFIAFAKSRHFDPLVAENWYSLSLDDVLKFSGAGSVLSHYKGSFMQALMELFPDIGLNLHGFKILPKHYWQSIPNRRKFFLDLAEKRDFSPLTAENWYRISHDDILASKGALALVNYYDGSFVAALIHLFPELKFDKSKFVQLRNQKFRQVSDRRRFLEALAAARGLDPLVPENWYKIAAEEEKLKDISTLLTYYRDNFGRMVLHLFPDIDLDKTKFYKCRGSRLTNLK